MPPALPLGLIEDANYESVRFVIPPEARLTLCTDGLPEASNPSGELFGFARVSELLSRCAHANEIAEAACAFGQDDDITVVTLERVPLPALAPA